MHNARRREAPITATTGSARLAGGSSDPAAPLARERAESCHRRASRPPPSPHPRVQAVIARRQIRVGSGRIHTGVVELWAPAALVGSGAGGPSESRAGPRPPLQLRGGVCARSGRGGWSAAAPSPPPTAPRTGGRRRARRRCRGTGEQPFPASARMDVEVAKNGWGKGRVVEGVRVVVRIGIRS
jgi:hypothetical protein